MSNLIIIFAKQPIPGQTKTRLTSVLTADEAANLYHAFLLDKIASLEHLDADAAIAYFPPEGQAYFEAIAPHLYLTQQTGPDLTARLSQAVEWGFAQGYDQVMVADGDSPTLPTEYLNEAFATLTRVGVDMVLGPAEDGGYYALAMKQPYTDLFNITFSTEFVAEDTLAIAAELSLEAIVLAAWYDVDEPQDLTRLYRDLDGTDSPTAHYLRLLIDNYPHLLPK